jgi:hypothetical protein
MVRTGSPSSSWTSRTGGPGSFLAKYARITEVFPPSSFVTVYSQHLNEPAGISTRASVIYVVSLG